MSWFSTLRPYRIHLALLTVFTATVIGLSIAMHNPYAEEAEQIHSSYFYYFYDEYKKTLPDAEAYRLADFYARYYANYYTSKAYKEYQKYALPRMSAEAVDYPDSQIAGLTTNAYGYSLIREFEGLRLDVYEDVGGLLTIGYGHLMRPGEYQRNISAAEAERLLQEDVRIAEAIVKRHVKTPLSSNQFSALVSLAYNIGERQFMESTLVKHLNAYDYNAASQEFARWNKVQGETIHGLSRRRAAEQQLFISG